MKGYFLSVAEIIIMFGTVGFDPEASLDLPFITLGAVCFANPYETALYSWSVWPSVSHSGRNPFPAQLPVPFMLELASNSTWAFWHAKHVLRSTGHSVTLQ